MIQIMKKSRENNNDSSRMTEPNTSKHQIVALPSQCSLVISEVEAKQAEIDRKKFINKNWNSMNDAFIKKSAEMKAKAEQSRKACEAKKAELRENNIQKRGISMSLKTQIDHLLSLKYSNPSPGVLEYIMDFQILKVELQQRLLREQMELVELCEAYPRDREMLKRLKRMKREFRHVQLTIDRAEKHLKKILDENDKSREEENQKLAAHQREVEAKREELKLILDQQTILEATRDRQRAEIESIQAETADINAEILRLETNKEKQKSQDSEVDLKESLDDLDTTLDSIDSDDLIVPTVSKNFTISTPIRVILVDKKNTTALKKSSSPTSTGQVLESSNVRAHTSTAGSSSSVQGQAAANNKRKSSEIVPVKPKWPNFAPLPSHQPSAVEPLPVIKQIKRTSLDLTTATPQQTQEKRRVSAPAVLLKPFRPFVKPLPVQSKFATESISLSKTRVEVPVLIIDEEKPKDLSQAVKSLNQATSSTSQRKDPVAEKKSNEEEGVIIGSSEPSDDVNSPVYKALGLNDKSKQKASKSSSEISRNFAENDEDDAELAGGFENMSFGKTDDDKDDDGNEFFAK